MRERANRSLQAGLPQNLDPRGARLILAAAMVVAFVLVLLWAGDRTFAIDEWDFLTQRGAWTVDNFLRPTNSHLIVLPLLFYKAILSAFGAESHLPLTLFTIALQCLVAGMVYAIASRRLGAWVGLLPALLILFYGAGWEVLVNTAGMQNQIATAAGLGMLLALDRGDRRGDALAGILLAVSLASFTVGLAFAVGAAVRILVERVDGRSLRRLALVAVPLAAYLVWFVWARKYHQGTLSAYSIGSIASGIFDQVNTGMAGITGLFRVTGGPSVGDALILDVSRTSALVFVLAAAIGWRVFRGPPLTPAAWAAIGTLITYLLLVAVGLDEVRGPTASRYAYMFTVLLMVVGSELLAGIRIARAWVYAAAVALFFSLLANVSEIRTAGQFFEQESDYNRAELGTMEMVRPEVPPAYVAESEGKFGLLPHQDLLFPAADYFDAVDRFGSPADTPEEIATEPEYARKAADGILVRALGLTVGPPEHGAEYGPLAPPVALNATVQRRGPCLRLTPESKGNYYAAFDVAPGGISYAGSAAPASIEVGRFVDPPSIALPTAAASGTIRIPADDYGEPWRVAFQARTPTTFCQLPPA